MQLGYSRHAIAHRLRSGRLHRVHPGVFSVGRPDLDRPGHWMAAVLACGRGALISHQTAAELWGIGRPRCGDIDVSVPAKAADRTVRGVRLHRRRCLGVGDRSGRHGIPATSPVRTLLDLATELAPPLLEAAVNQADKRDLVDPEQLRRALDELRGQRGAPALRRLLDRRTFRLTDSELERRFLRVARNAGLPTPQTRQIVNGFRVDFFWPDFGLVVETDGLRYHRTAAQQARDRRRDQVHTVAGLTTLRFTHAQVRYEARAVRDTLQRVAAQLARRRNAA
jgi:very-short-patch-repair endonuclease